jgi:prepilin-type N-terminal cleavage/methylation domain-containing protein
MTCLSLKKKKALTLLELLIAVVLLSVLSLGFFNIHFFTQDQVIQGDRRARVQNDVSFALSHMAKQLRGTDQRGGAIGTALNPPDSLPVELTTVNGDNGMLVWIDFDNNGVRDDTNDKQIAYAYDAANHTILFYPNFTDAPLVSEAITESRIMPDFSDDATARTHVLYDQANNFIEVQITGRWNPDVNAALNNPEVRMTTRINMPSVSLN